MKVRLTGIRAWDESWHCKHSAYQTFSELLQQIAFPLEIETVEGQDDMVSLKGYVKDPYHPGGGEVWGLAWFDHEIVQPKETQQ